VLDCFSLVVQLYAANLGKGRRCYTIYQGISTNWFENKAKSAPNVKKAKRFKAKAKDMMLTIAGRSNVSEHPLPAKHNTIAASSHRHTSTGNMPDATCAKKFLPPDGSAGNSSHIHSAQSGVGTG
jgi:hypothetical protein